MRTLHGRAPRTRAVTASQARPLAAQLPDPVLHRLLSDDPAWLRAAQTDWGLCGVWVGDDQDRCRALALVCPALHLPSGHPLDGHGRLPHSAQLVALAGGDGSSRPVRLVVQGLARHLAGRVRAVDALASSPGASCLQPEARWLLDSGFRPVDPRPSGRARPWPTVGTPQHLRLELRRTVRWEQLPRAVRGWGDLVPRPCPPVEPTGRDLTATRD